MNNERPWYELREPEQMATPALVVYRDRLVANVDAAIAAAGGPDTLRPHIKTHKSADVVRLHLARGVTRFKCATVAEATMLAIAGCKDILLAYQPVGPTLDALLSLARDFPRVRIACVFDSVSAFRAAEDGAERRGAPIAGYVDLNVGMDRTGIEPGPLAHELHRAIATSRWIEAGGIHAYDGHVHDPELSSRDREAARSRGVALQFAREIVESGHEVPELVLGGTPAFGCHARALDELRRGASGDSGPTIRLSPGTYTYYDWGSASRYPELPFVGAALVLGRVISVPGPGRFTIDVGSKAIAADPPQPRATILNVPDATAGPQSEEHWVFTVDPELTPFVGMAVYLWPSHICPTVEHYDELSVVDAGGTVRETWEVTARGRTVSRSR